MTIILIIVSENKVLPANFMSKLKLASHGSFLKHKLCISIVLSSHFFKLYFIFVSFSIKFISFFFVQKNIFDIWNQNSVYLMVHKNYEETLSQISDEISENEFMCKTI